MSDSIFNASLCSEFINIHFDQIYLSDKSDKKMSQINRYR